MPINQKELFNQNPWWENPKNIDKDPKIMDFNKSGYKWIPKSINRLIEAKPFSFFVFRGPRQVGKTTALKLTIRNLLSKINPQKLFFFDCEALFDVQDLKEIIIEYFKLLEVLKIDDKCHIFLDEITGIDGWSKILKYLIDQNQFKNCIVVISGSNAVDLKKGADRLPGRKGGGCEISFLPLSFSEFLTVSGNSDLAVNKFAALPLEPEFIYEESKKNLLKLPKLTQKLHQYLLTGGFPRLVNEFLTAGSIAYSTYESYQDWIKGEISKQRRDERRALQLIAELGVVLGSKIGWDTIAKRMGGISHHTIEEYVELLDLLFIGKPLYQIDLAKKRINWRRGKKFYFIDSLVYILALALNEKWGDIFNRSLEIVAENKKESVFIEQTVFNHLLRLSRAWMDHNLAFFSNSSEIDFILMQENGLLPVEVKWQNEVSARDIYPMQKLQFKQGIVLSKQSFEKQSNFVIIPAPLFLAAI